MYSDYVFHEFATISFRPSEYLLDQTVDVRNRPAKCLKIYLIFISQCDKYACFSDGYKFLKKFNKLEQKIVCRLRGSIFTLLLRILEKTNLKEKPSFTNIYNLTPVGTNNQNILFICCNCHVSLLITEMKLLI